MYASVIVEMFQLIFRVFICAFRQEISSFFGNIFLFLFLLFVLSVLGYFPFHVVSILILVLYCVISMMEFINTQDASYLSFMWREGKEKTVLQNEADSLLTAEARLT